MASTSNKQDAESGMQQDWWLCGDCRRIWFNRMASQHRTAQPLDQNYRVWWWFELTKGSVPNGDNYKEWTAAAPGLRRLGWVISWLRWTVFPDQQHLESGTNWHGGGKGCSWSCGSPKRYGLPHIIGWSCYFKTFRQYLTNFIHRCSWNQDAACQFFHFSICRWTNFDSFTISSAQILFSSISLFFLQL